MRTYQKPDDIDAPRVRPQIVSNELTPESDVVVVFRGGPPVCDMWDGQDYVLPPLPPDVTLHDWKARTHPASHWSLSYGVAQHLQARAIVPATRNPHDYRKALSQLGIVGVDRTDRCEPFTAEQLKKFGFKEGIDRRQFLDGRRNVTFVDTAEALAATGGELADETLDALSADDAATPPAMHEGLREVAAAEAETGQTRRTRASKTKFDDEK